MAQVKEWVSGFLMAHMRRFPGDWPRDDMELADLKRVWLSALARNEVREDEAEAASLRLAETPPQFRRDHLPAVVAAVKVIRYERGAGTNEAETRESARLASKDCRSCSGEGLTVVWHPAPDPGHRAPRTTAAYCLCRHGRWISRAHRLGRETAEIAKRIVELQAVLEGESWWRPSDPQLPEVYQVPEIPR